MWKKYLFITVGWLAVMLGLIGIFLPVLPTTPFLILAASLFAKSSERFHHWLLNSPLFGPIIQDWQATRCIAPKVKIWAMIAMTVTFASSIFFVPFLAVRLFLIATMMVCLTCIFRLPNCPSSATKS